MSEKVRDTEKPKVGEKRKNGPFSGGNAVMLIIGGLVVLAVAVAAIVISSQSTGAEHANIDYSQVPQSRTEDGAFVLGNPEAPITIVAFEDFLCPHCQAYKPTINELMEKYVATGLARFEYRMLPAVDPTYSVVAARLAECADTLNPGAFWEAHDVLFELASKQRFNNESARAFAEQMSLSYTDVLDCAEDARQVDVDRALAQSLQVSGTPTVMVRYGDGDMTRIPGASGAPSIDVLQAVIQNAQ